MKEKRSSFPFFRTISAHMIERYIFNFRLRPDALARKLPVPWLEPQSINGWSVLSFCILWLDKLTIAPIPPLLRFSTISCAYRIGVIDCSAPKPEPSVYVTDRYADLPLIARLAPWIMQDTIPMVKAAVGHTPAGSHVQMSYPDGRHLFSADVKPAGGGLVSEVFASLDAFATFIKEGVGSYAPSIFPDAYTRVDLEKEDVGYEALDADIEFSALNADWGDAGLIFDSAVRAKGASYRWTYRGLYDAQG